VPLGTCGRAFQIDRDRFSLKQAQEAYLINIGANIPIGLLRPGTLLVGDI
jgi:hypothetical protein